MKTSIRILAISFVMIMISVSLTKQASAQQGYVSFQVFYDQLSPYGQWLSNPDYGYVWIPDAGWDFAPYSTMGHWILTDYGWTWISYYDWGWAPFHYGRWDYDNYYGWFWIPDNEWGPAWVTWRRSSGYYGWAPMGPGISISLSFGRDYNRDNNHWIFVRDRYFDRSDVSRYYVNRTSRDRIIRNSIVINNTYVDNRYNTTYVSGPKREDVQKYTGRKVIPVAVQENERPGQDMSNGRLNIYRPQVMKNSDMGQRPAPSRIVDLKDVKRPTERNAANQPRNSNRPQNVNQPLNVNQPQQVNQPNNSRQEQKQNNVTPQKSNTDSKAPEQQNATSTQNNKKEEQPVTVKPTVRNKNEKQEKSKSKNNRRKTK